MRIFISYSRADTKWLKRLQIHLKPITRQFHVDVWDDTRLTPGSKWRQEIATALDESDIAILLISADFLNSDFVFTNELPPLLRSAEDRGTLILPVIASPSVFGYLPDLAQYKTVNDPSKPLDALSKSEQGAIFVKVAEAILKRAVEAKRSPKSEQALKESSNSSEPGRESFLDDATWTRLVKVGDWVYDQGIKRIIGGGVHTYLLSRSEYGNTPFSIDARLAFSGFSKYLREGTHQVNAGVVFGWNADAKNPRYYNMLITGEEILLEGIGLTGGSAYRDFHHLSEGKNFKLEEDREYSLNVNLGSDAIDVFSDQEFLCSLPCPERMVGRVGLRPWRSQIHCSRFVVSGGHTTV